MSQHDATHEERLHAAAFSMEPAASDVIAQVADCDECLRQLARITENVHLIAGERAAARSARLEAMLEEVLAWCAVSDGGGGDGGEAVAALRQAEVVKRRDGR